MYFLDSTLYFLFSILFTALSLEKTLKTKIKIRKIEKITFTFQVTKEELHDLVKKNLPWYCKLLGGIIFMDQLPRVSTGKIDKKQLKLLARKYCN